MSSTIRPDGTLRSPSDKKNNGGTQRPNNDIKPFDDEKAAQSGTQRPAATGNRPQQSGTQATVRNNPARNARAAVSSLSTAGTLLNRVRNALRQRAIVRNNPARNARAAVSSLSTGETLLSRGQSVLQRQTSSRRNRVRNALR